MSNNFKLESTNHIKDRYDDIHKLRSSFDKQNTVTNRRSYNHEYYSWKLRMNPFGKGVCNIVEADGQTVGMATVTPKKMTLPNNTETAVEIGDTFTHSNYQRKGIFSKVVNSVRDQAQKNEMNFIYGTPNSNSLPGYLKKLNFDIIESANISNFVFPININNILRVKIKSKVFSYIINILTSPIIKIIRYFNKSKIDSSYVIEEVSLFSNDINKVWLHEKHKYDCAIDRNDEYLNWRFVDNPDKYNIFIAKKNDSICGYVVLKSGFWSGLKVGYIADILTIDDGSHDVFDALLEHSIDYYKKMNFDMISSWIQLGCYSQRLSKSGFYKYKPVPIICFRNHLGLDIIKSNYSWYFTISDSDNI